eukprot:TRINITY_DN45593_c0_g1_i1.p1 TRINITY_DN45593_c0_g1~~TRINITY_DN45593_c0_g1_i1.p1  ORF type:complete len:207 (+),score=19.94 TRINITY_DN45593_c0_g1_i1:127-747(+)
MAQSAFAAFQYVHSPSRRPSASAAVKPAEPAAPLMTAVSPWFAEPQAHAADPGIGAYQNAPAHAGMMHPPRNSAVRRDLLEYLAANGITKMEPRTPHRNGAASRKVTSSAPDLSSPGRPARRAPPRWRPSGFSPVRKPGLGALLPDSPVRDQAEQAEDQSSPRARRSLSQRASTSKPRTEVRKLLLPTSELAVMHNREVRRRSMLN